MVEIMPKKTPGLSKWINILFYFSLALLIFSIASYFILDYSLKKSRKILTDLEESLARKETPEEIVLEKEILGYQKKIKDFSQLIGQHLETSEVFNFIQKNSHPSVWFSQFNLDSRENIILISGTTDSFETFNQQILIFKRENFVQDINIKKILIGKKGKIEFILSLSIDPKIFSFQFSQKIE